MYGRQSEKGETVIDVRRLLAIKANIETAMQRDLAPHIRVFAQQQLGEVCKAIEEAREEWDKLFEQQKIDQLKQRVVEMEASNTELLEALKNECRLCRHGNGNSFNPDCPNGKMCLIHGAIQKERGQG